VDVDPNEEPRIKFTLFFPSFSVCVTIPPRTITNRRMFEFCLIRQVPFMTLLHRNDLTNSKIDAFPRFEKLGTLRITSNTRRLAIFGATALHTEGHKSFASTRRIVRDCVPPSEGESAITVEPYPENPSTVSTSPNEEFSKTRSTSNRELVVPFDALPVFVCCFYFEGYD